jgi:cobalt/nickel transport system ATP-binding protein
MALISCEQVEYSYPLRSFLTLKNINFTIKERKKYAIIGHNGCGKTTLLRLLNGLYRPQKGVIKWQDKALNYEQNSLVKLRQEVGLVFQDPEQQVVGGTVEEDLAYGLANLGLSAQEISLRLQQALEDFQLTELATNPLHHLSLGQKKRLSLADIMILQPKLLLLDEPTAYLDPQQTRNLWRMLEKIAAEGTTIVMATHNLDFVYAWADWIVVMDGGKVVLENTPEEVFKQRQVMAALGLGIPLTLGVWERVGLGNSLQSFLREQYGG